MQVESFLENSARLLPDKVALITADRRFTYREVNEDANRVAHLLQAAGVGRHARVVIDLENGIEAVVAIFAVLKAGAVFVVVNPTTKPTKLAFILNNCRAIALITDHRRATGLRESRIDTPYLRVVMTVGGSAPSGQATNLDFTAAAPTTPLHPNGCIDIDLAALIYTSGSTGQPKGVMVTHLNIVSAATSITTYLGSCSDDTVLSVLPLSFDYGLYQLLMTCQVGGTLALERSFTYPHATLELIQHERVTGLPLVPTMAALLLQMDLTKYDLSSLRYITNTGAALAASHIAALRRLLPAVKLFSMYGLTECKRVSYLPPDQIDARPTSVGRGMPNEEVYLVDGDGNRIATGTGELVIRGSNVMKGYWELPDETDRVLRPGPLPGDRVLFSGDLFRIDEEGYLYFVARKDEMIKSRGQKVSPREVEEALYACPAVAEAAVIGVPDPLLHEAVKAVIALKEGQTISEQAVRRHCAALVEDFMVPTIIEFRDTLPKTPSGKIDRKQLASSVVPFTSPNVLSRAVLQLDVKKEVRRITDAIRDQVFGTLRRKGVVIGLSGGVDSSVAAALCVQALGPSRVLGLCMPEVESSETSLALATRLAEGLAIPWIEEEITPILAAAGAYRRRDESIAAVIPGYTSAYRCKMAAPAVTDGQYRLPHLVVESPAGVVSSAPIKGAAYLAIVAATNFKQRTRKMLEYYHADRLHYAVIGTPNRLELELGFFVKNGDGAADLKPIAHLYKSQVYQLARALGIPDEIQQRCPTTDTYSLPQSQEEFYFPLPLEDLDLCLYGQANGIPAVHVAHMLNVSEALVSRTYGEIDQKRRTTQYLHKPPLTVETPAYWLDSGR